jgi:Na+-transporting NADH:ubiquinone oxidoreductase subunit NqrF
MTILLATLATALGVLVLAAILLLRRTTREVKEEVGKVHAIVNQHRTDMLNFQQALVQALVDHGIEVPIDQSLPVEGEDT